MASNNLIVNSGESQKENVMSNKINNLFAPDPVSSSNERLNDIDKNAFKVSLNR